MYASKMNLYPLIRCKDKFLYTLKLFKIMLRNVNFFICVPPYY